MSNTNPHRLGYDQSYHSLLCERKAQTDLTQTSVQNPPTLRTSACQDHPVAATLAASNAELLLLNMTLRAACTYLVLKICDQNKLLSKDS